MTPVPPDERPEDPPRDQPAEEPVDGDAGEPLDVDAEFSKIVEGLGDDWATPSTAEGLAERFHTRGWADAPVPASQDEVNLEVEHFVPPEPPPVPRPEPARLLAWVATLGAPVAMIALAVFRIRPEGWVMFLMAMAFLAGLVYLISTMRRDDDPWSGDDGAVI
ncbi:MAG: hypothetical protein QM655_08575 [Nocardioidaceae bacterium]